MVFDIFLVIDVIVKSCWPFLIYGQDGAVGSAWGEPAPAAAPAAAAATAARHGGMIFGARFVEGFLWIPRMCGTHEVNPYVNSIV